MECVARFVRTALSRVRGDGRDQVVLRHRAHGTVLAHGLTGGDPVRFESAADAVEFSRRFLDEGPAWEPVDVVELDLAAA